MQRSLLLLLFSIVCLFLAYFMQAFLIKEDDPERKSKETQASILFVFGVFLFIGVVSLHYKVIEF